MAGIAFMRRLAVGLLLVSLLGACAGIPTSGDVQGVPETSVVPEPNSFRVIVRPPVAGLAPRDVVAGFINAHADVTQNYSIARLYLTNQHSSQWRSGTVALVDSSTISFEQPQANQVTMTYTRLGDLQPDGYLRLLDSPVSETAIFGLTEQNDEWRINAGPNLAFMNFTDLQRNFTAQQVYFFDDEFQYLVPVTYWLTGSEEVLATRLMKTLLSGPNNGLETVFRTAIPSDTKLEIDAVLKVDSVFQVSLNAAAFKAVDDLRIAMLAQIATTLNRVGTQVEIRIGNQLQSVDGVQPIRTNSFTQFSPDPVLGSFSVFSVTDQVLQGGGVEGSRDLLNVGEVSKFAVSADGRYVATSSGREVRVQRLNGTDLRTFTVSARSLEFDSDNNLWVANNQGKLSVYNQDSTITQVAGLGGVESVLDLQIAPDGTQIVMLVATGSGLQLRHGFVSQSGGAIAIVNLSRVERIFDDVLDFDWLSSKQLIVVARVGSFQPRVYEIEIGTVQPRLVASPVEFVRVSATPGVPTIAESADGVIWTFQAGQWRSNQLVSGSQYLG
jgi:Lipoprotein LpqB beta-propeller domain/Sporulation and spore germination